VKCVLSIGVSDSSGTAGLQGDLRVLQRLGVHAATAVTAIQAREGETVRRQLLVPAQIIQAQIDAAARGRGVDAVKVGPLPSWQCAETIAARVRRRRLPNVVLEPGLRGDGERALGTRGLAAVRARLLPRTWVVVLDVTEASALVGTTGPVIEELPEITRRVRSFGVEAVLVEIAASETVFSALGLDDGRAWREFPWAVCRTDRTSRGALSAAIAARLALGDSVEQAVEFAARFLGTAQPGSGESIVLQKDFQIADLSKE
jgi:hydroxymethylpyrimidine/phosphomethylpyrimidine kinase